MPLSREANLAILSLRHACRLRCLLSQGWEPSAVSHLHFTTTTVNSVEAVAPADTAVTFSAYVPTGVKLLAINVSIPDGLVSDAAYFTLTPAGNPVNETTAVSLVESMKIITFTGVSSRDSVIFSSPSITEIGCTAEIIDALLPHPLSISAAESAITPHTARGTRRSNRTTTSRGRNSRTTP